MQSAAQSATVPESKGRILTGRIISGVIVFLLAFDSIGKLLKVAPVIKGTTELGYPESVIVPIGIILLFCTIIYAVPRTAILGAVLLTGYLGGAVATHVRVGSHLFTHVLFPVYLGILIWLALYLRDLRLRPLVPLRS